MSLRWQSRLSGAAQHLALAAAELASLALAESCSYYSLTSLRAFRNSDPIHAIDCTHLFAESASLSSLNSLHLDRKAGTIIHKQLSNKAGRGFLFKTGRLGL